MALLLHIAKSQSVECIGGGRQSIARQLTPSHTSEVCLVATF